MAVREFDGTDELATAIGGLSGMQYGTIAYLVRYISGVSGVRTAFQLHDSGGSGDYVGLYNSNSIFDLIWYDGSSFNGTANDPVPVGPWALVVGRKPTGSNDARYSVYDYTADTWTHEEAADPTGDGSSPGAGGDVRFSYEGTANFFEGRIAARAAWSNSLPWSADASGDSAIEAAGLEDAASNWLDASPDAMWLFNQAATTTDVEDVTDGGADQTSLSGTTVVTDDDPPGFDFSLSSGSDITPAAQTVHATPGTLAMSIGVVPDAVTVDATPGTVTVAPGPVDITPATVTVEATPAAVSMSIGVTPGAVTVDATPGTLAVDMAMVPDPVTINATSGTLSITQDAQNVTPDPVTVETAPGTVTLTTGAVDITPDAVTIDVTPGALTLDVDVTLAAPTVHATPGTLTVVAGAVGITPDDVTIGVTPGTVTISGGGIADPNPFSITHNDPGGIAHRDPAGITHRESFAISYQEPA